MSQNLTNFIRTIFVADAGNVRAVMGGLQGSFRSFERDLAGIERRSGLVNQQLRAMGTTLRYALSGAAIFGAAGAVGQLSQIQQQLGLMSAIAPSAGLPQLSANIREFGESAEDAAFRALTPITDFNDGLINLLSTVQGVPQNEIVPILEQIAQTARLSLTPVDEATKGISGLAVAFGQTPNLQNFQRFLAEYQKVIFTVPGGAAAGPQIIQQLPQLAAVARYANINPEEMFGFLQTSLRFGGSPATTTRGLQYLLQGLATPPSEPAEKALKDIGITPEFTQTRGGKAALNRLLDAVLSAGFKGDVEQLGKMTDTQLEAIVAEQGEDAPVSSLGITGAGAELARTAIGRIHGVRALIILAAQRQQVRKDQQAIINLGGDHAKQVEELRGAWERFAKEADLRRASLAVNQMAVDVVQAFEPLLNFGASGLVKLRDLVDENPNIAAYGGLGAIGLLAASRGTGIFGRLGRLGGLGFAAPAIVENIVNPNALGIPIPLPVVIVGGMPGGLFGKPGGPGGVPVPGTPGAPVPGTPGGNVPKQAPRRLPKFTGKGGAKGAGWLAVAAMLWQLINGGPMPGEDEIEPDADRFLSGIGGREQSSLRAATLAGYGAVTRPTSRLRGIHNAGTERQMMLRLKGQADLAIRVEHVDSQGRVLKTERTHVSAELWPQFTEGRYPQTRGQRKSLRGQP